MSSDLTEFRGRGLLPFQAQFVQDFLREDVAAVWELASPPGTGKVYLSIEIIRRILDMQGDARVLILVPAVLSQQWVDRLISRGAPALLLDRRRFIERAAAVPEGQPFWPAPAVVVMSIDFAKRNDVLSALHEVEWDLILADESHLLAGKRADVFFGLQAAQRARRGLMLTSVPSERDYPSSIAVARRVISFQDIVDWEGRPMFERAQPRLEIVTYTRSLEERAVLRELETFAAHIARLSPELQFYARLLVRAAASSSLAAQRAAWRLRGTLTHARNLASHGRPLDPAGLGSLQSDLFADSADSNPKEPGIPSSDVITLYSHTTPLDALLTRWDEIPDDRKLQALVSFLERTADTESRSYVCIWIQFRATAQYLATALDRRAVPVFGLEASMPLAERMAIADRFRATGGVLLTTAAAIEGLDLAFVEQCIHYDLPVNLKALEQRVGRFLRVGRVKPFRSVALRDSQAALTWEEQVFAELGEQPRTT